MTKASAADGSVISAVQVGFSRDSATERAFRRRIATALGVGLAALVGLILASVFLFIQDQQHGRWVDHTYAAESKISRLATLTERMETARRGYLLRPDPTYWDTYVRTRDELPAGAEAFGAYTRDNPRQQALTAQVRALIAAKLLQMRDTIERAHAGDLEGGRRSYFEHSSQRLTQQLRGVFARMQAEEQSLLDARTRREHRSALALISASMLTTGLLLVLVVGAAVLVRRYADDLHTSQLALRRLNEGLESAVRDRTAELTRANAEIQRFAYIVSHDLRSPLVNVMGFTSELEATMEVLRGQIARTEEMAPGVLKPETRAAVFEDMPEAIGFIRSSTRKMDRLINAILALSRQGRRTLNPEPLDMDALVQGVADSLRRLAEDRGATVTVEGPLPDLVHDRLAIEQVLSNVMENAVKYASADRPGRVVVRGRAQGGRAVLEVVDNGRGVDPKDHERIFDLFRRAGQQDQPGEGIGLAHVRALVYRLGGSITIDSELGRGATFRIDLPRRLGREDS